MPVPPGDATPFETSPRHLKASARTTLITFLTLLIGIVLLSFRMVQSFLLPVIMGAVLAQLTRPLYRTLCGRGGKRKGPAFLVTAGLGLVILLPVGLVIFMGVRQGITVGQTLSESRVSLQGMTQRIAGWSITRAFGLDSTAVEGHFQELVRIGGEFLLSVVAVVASHLLSIALQLILIALSCFFFLVDGSRLLAWTQDKIPMDQAVRGRLLQSFGDASSSVIWATVASSSAQAVSMALLFLMMGIPAPALAAGGAFFLAWIPIIGASPIWLLGGLYLLVQGSTGKMMALIVAGLLMGVMDNVIRTAILNGRNALHPLVSLVSIFGGIEMFGMMGIFLGPIIAVLMISILNVWPVLGRRLELLEDAPPAVS